VIRPSAGHQCYGTATDDVVWLGVEAVVVGWLVPVLGVVGCVVAWEVGVVGVVDAVVATVDVVVVARVVVGASVGLGGVVGAAVGVVGLGRGLVVPGSVAGAVVGSVDVAVVVVSVVVVEDEVVVESLGAAVQSGDSPTSSFSVLGVLLSRASWNQASNASGGTHCAGWGASPVRPNALCPAW
jgi:hypothetical protein